MTLIAMCGSFIARFTNCNRKHAEQFMVKDKRLLQYIQQNKPSMLVLFLKHHPCHKSGGNALRPGSFEFTDERSCTNLIINFKNTVLKPNGVQLCLRVAWLYKAFWKQATLSHDIQASKNSLEGLQMLFKENIMVEAISKRDWIILANMCNEPINLNLLFSRKRMLADEFNARFLQEQRDLLVKQQQQQLQEDQQQREQNLLQEKQQK